MNRKNSYKLWNRLNITIVVFLSLLVLLLMIFSKSESFITAYSTYDDVSTVKKLNEKEEQLSQLEANLLEREENLNLLEKQIKEQNSESEWREQIVQKLTDEFSGLNQVLNVDGETGAIGFGTGILFETSEDEITDDGIAYLSELIPACFSIILNEEYRDYIAEIIIEGHGDNEGSYLSNLNLSQKRALAVIKFLFGDEIPAFEYQDIMQNYITANGRSYSRPIITDENIDKDKSRRVEFKFQLKDKEAINEIKKIIDERTAS